MPTKLEWTSDSVIYEMTFENGEYRSAAELAGTLTKLADELSQAISAEQFIIHRQGITNKYDFEMHMVGGRNWSQILTFDNPKDPLILFTSSDEWRASELQMHSKIWNFLIGMVANGLTDLELTYL